MPFQATYFAFSDKYLIFGMGDGAIRINKIKDDFTDLSDFYLLHMHDNFNGKMSICFSYDNKHLFTAGTDGNLFSYAWNAETKEVRPINPFPAEPVCSAHLTIFFYSRFIIY
jgi:cilia- and flagella-associated protein 44